MSKNRNRACLNKALTSKEYTRKIFYLKDDDFIYGHVFFGKLKRQYRTWKYNRTTKYKKSYDLSYSRKQYDLLSRL